jgi:hypothetical protein
LKRGLSPMVAVKMYLFSKGVTANTVTFLVCNS